MKKRILCCIIIILLIIAGLITSNTIKLRKNNNEIEVAPLPEAYKEWLELPEEEKQKAMKPRSFEIKLDGDSILQNLVGDTVENSYPGQYDLRDYNGVKAVKNQRSWGYCWAYAGTSCLESQLLVRSRNGINEQCVSTNFNLNPMHVGYALAYQFDYNVNNKYGNKPLNHGGNAIDDVLYWTSGIGPVTTEKFSVTSESEPIELPSTDILVGTENVQVDNAIFLPTINILNATEEERTNYINLIKQTILDNGAVAFASAAPTSTWYNSQNYAVYSESYSEYAASAHEMLIVGWDDNFSKEKFNKGSVTGEYPAIDGAWIVQNSWGESFGNNGYCYYSYMDYTLNNGDIMAVSKTSEINYDNIYQYNPTGDIGRMEGKYAANVFSKSKNNEKLTEVSFYNFYPNTEYKIYVNPINEELSGENVKFVQSYKDTNTFAEYINIELDEPIELTGEKFAIILKVSNSSGYYCNIPYLMKANTNVEKDYVNIKEGQSFVSTDGENYTDTVDRGAIFIKGFTINSTENAQAELKSTINTNEVELKGEEEGILVTTIAQNITNKEKLNYSIYNSADEDFTEKFNITKSSNGNTYYANIVIPNDYSLIGDYKIKIQYEDVAEIIDVKISRKHITEIKFARNGVYLQKGDTNNLTYKVSTLPADILDLDIKYRSLDESIATVTEEGIVTAISEGNTKVEIYATDGGDASKQIEIIVVNLQEEMAGGDGTEENPYLIETPEQLNLVRADLTANYKLNNDIDLTKETSEGGKFYNEGKGWEPIGYAEYDNYYDGGLMIFYRKISELRSGYKREGFSGTLDGNNYYIKGLNICRDEYFVSLFGLIENATIKNLNMINGNIKGIGFASGVTGGAINSTIKNVYNYNSITGNKCMGGIVGQADICDISQVYNLGKIKGIYYEEKEKKIIWLPERIGGVVGSFLEGNLSVAYNSADINVVEASRIGGVCGRTTKVTIENVYNRGNIIEETLRCEDSGGIVGYISHITTILNSYNTGNFYSNVIPQSSDIQNRSYGNIVGGTDAGKLIINDVYFIENGNESIGRILWNGEITNNSYGKTEEELKKKDTYVNFDFENIWQINEDEFPTFIGLKKEVVLLSIKNLPTKLYYLVNKEELDITNLEIVALYKDGSKEKIEVTEDMITGFDNTKLGEQEITVTYEGVSATFTITVETGTLEITSQPTKLIYLQNKEELDLTGCKVALKLSNGRVIEEIEVTEDMITGFDNTKLGEQEITVTYEGMIAIFTVKVEEGTTWNISATEEDEVYAKLSNSGTLFIEGKGKTADFKMYDTPWKNETINYIKVEEGVESLGKNIFGDTSAYEIYISSSVKEIFCDSLRCGSSSELKNIIVSAENIKYCSIDGILYNKEVTELIHYPEAKEETIYYIPDTIEKIGDMSIEFNKNIKKIIVNSNTKYIGYYAMKNCEKLEKIFLPKGIEKLGYGAFVYSSEAVIYTNNDTVIKYANENGYSYIIDKDAPTVTEIKKENNTITIIGAIDGEGVGLARKPYSFDGGITWQEENYKEYDDIPENEEILVRDELYNVYRVYNEEKASTPEAIIDYKDNELEALEIGAKYRVSGEKITTTEFISYGIQKIADDWYGKTISLIQVKENEEYNSDEQIIEIPSIREAPSNIRVEDASNSKSNDAKILGWNIEMEFSRDEITWTKCTEESTKNLNPGNCYIRYSYIENNQFSGKIKYLYIGYERLHFNNNKEYSIPAGNINTRIESIDLVKAAEIDGGDLPYAYMKISGPDWIDISNTGIITGTRPSQAQEATTAVIKIKDEFRGEINITINVGEVSESLLKGDINKDGKLTLYDAFSILRKIITDEQSTKEQNYIMDYNDDGKITLYDAFSFLRMIILM